MREIGGSVGEAGAIEACMLQYLSRKRNNLILVDSMSDQKYINLNSMKQM